MRARSDSESRRRFRTYRVYGRTLACLCTAAIWVVCAFAAGRASAGEEDDLQRLIENQRTGAADLERLDELKATGDETSLLRSWLDDAWALRSKHEYDQVRDILDRCLRQADLIRAKITLSKLKAEAQKHDTALSDLRTKIARTRKALQDTTAKKQALEGSAQ